MILKTTLLLLAYNFAQAQVYLTTKVIIDSETQMPVEYVNVYNNSDNTISNADGSFTFRSIENLINISSVGYKSQSTTFDIINNSDTIFLATNNVELEEVVITNTSAILNDVYRNLENNYPINTYNERFFLRCTVRRNNEITRLQDVFGKIESSRLFKTREIKKIFYKTEILNMRKVDLTEKSTVEYLSFYNLEMLYGWFKAIFLNSKEYDFRNVAVNDSTYYKIAFSNTEEYKSQYPRKGYYLINKDDKAIKEVRYSISSPETEVYKFKKNIKWRTIETNLVVNFLKDGKTSKHYISNAKLSTVTEVINEITNQKDIYEVEYKLLTTESFIKDKIKSNFSVEKDLFKADFSYSEDFWKNQNQLLLTTELKEFLIKVSENKSKGSEYKIIGNFWLKGNL